ncbi:hypothetical protein [Methylomonas albis]|nr:hypothetical protein [Methylomonas albis]
MDLKSNSAGQLAVAGGGIKYSLRVLSNMTTLKTDKSG